MREWYITVEQSVQATTASAGRLWPPRQLQTKLTTWMQSEIRTSLRLSVYFAVVEVGTNGEQKLSWPVRIALR